MSHGKHTSSIALVREGVRFAHLYRIKSNDRIREVDADKFNVANGIDGIIRIPADIYPTIDDTLTRYTHFNLEFSGHKIGALYALPRIVTHGYFRSQGDERPPVLSFGDIFIVRCVAVREHVPYESLREKDFKFSMKHIYNVEELKKEMLFRYAVSMPMLTKRDILSRGVSVTTLRFIKKNQHLDI